MDKGNRLLVKISFGNCKFIFVNSINKQINNYFNKQVNKQIVKQINNFKIKSFT